MNLDPGSWVAWIIVGLISGAIAARVVAGRGFGCIADIVVGVAGAVIGGYLLRGALRPRGPAGRLGGHLLGVVPPAPLSVGGSGSLRGAPPRPTHPPAAPLL